MTCGCCLEACPQYNDSSEFIGAAALNQVRLFNLHPSGAMHKNERLDSVMGEGGVADCGKAQNCVEVCPKEIPLVDSISVVARDTTKRLLVRVVVEVPFGPAEEPPGAGRVVRGRIYKNERLAAAWARIVTAELGPRAAQTRREDARFLGVFEHLYEDGFGGPEASTHYVVLGHALTVPGLDLAALPSAQHGEYRLATRDELLADGAVHQNTRAYFV
jgi:hypothetical protein